MDDMDYGELEANFNSILNGQLPGAELVIGLVGPVGANLNSVTDTLAGCLQDYDYSVEKIRVSELIENVSGVSIPEYNPKDQYSRIDTLMTAGDEAREKTKNNAILALFASFQIYGFRMQEKEKTPRPRHAYVINSLKHPDEVNALRRIYGNGFFLIGVFVDREQRKKNLIGKDMTQAQAATLIDRDEAEGSAHGQRTRDTFHLSDFFLLQRDTSHIKATLQRFLKIVFAEPYQTPLFDEYAMFMAFAAATRSADLSRQIGAVIAKKDEVLAMGANECPRYKGGTYWPFPNDCGIVEDVKDGRDYMRGYDSNDDEKNRIIEGAVEAVRKSWKNAGKPLTYAEADLIKAGLESSAIDDITEYGRVVHAEMDALLTCARTNLSCRGATLYSTTFPCHNCAKHIIAAGITRVVYIEPYPKSKALEFHCDAVFAGFRHDSDQEKRVAFEPFVGVGPRRFFDLFSMRQGAGFPLKRKDKSTGKKLSWKPEDVTIRIPMLPWNYLDREEFAANMVKPHWKAGKNNAGQSGESGKATEIDGGTSPGSVEKGL